METLTEPSPLEKKVEKPRSLWKTIQRCWAQCRQIFDLVKICRFSLPAALLLPAVFIWNEQASEVLRCLAEGHADGGSAGRYQFLSFHAALVTFSLCLWYSSRVLLYFKYPNTRRDTEITLTI